VDKRNKPKLLVLSVKKIKLQLGNKSIGVVNRSHLVVKYCLIANVFIAAQNSATSSKMHLRCDMQMITPIS